MKLRVGEARVSACQKRSYIHTLSRYMPLRRKLTGEKTQGTCVEQFYIPSETLAAARVLSRAPQELRKSPAREQGPGVSALVGVGVIHEPEFCQGLIRAPRRAHPSALRVYTDLTTP